MWDKVCSQLLTISVRSLEQSFMTLHSNESAPFGIGTYFFNSSLKDLLVKFNECGDAFLERLRPLADGKTEVSMKEALHETTLGVISKVWVVNHKLI